MHCLPGMYRTPCVVLALSVLALSALGCARNDPRSPEPELTPASEFQTPEAIHDPDAPLTEPRPAPEPGPEPPPEPIQPPSDTTPPPILEGTGSFVDETGNTLYPD